MSRIKHVNAVSSPAFSSARPRRRHFPNVRSLMPAISAARSYASPQAIAASRTVFTSSVSTVGRPPRLAADPVFFWPRRTREPLATCELGFGGVVLDIARNCAAFLRAYGLDWRGIHAAETRLSAVFGKAGSINVEFPGKLTMRLSDLADSRKSNGIEK